MALIALSVIITVSEFSIYDPICTRRQSSVSIVLKVSMAMNKGILSVLSVQKFIIQVLQELQCLHLFKLLLQ